MPQPIDSCLGHFEVLGLGRSRGVSPMAHRTVSSPEFGTGGPGLAHLIPEVRTSCYKLREAGGGSDPDTSVVCLGRPPPIPKLAALVHGAASGSEEPASVVLGSLSPACLILHVHLQPQALVEGLLLLPGAIRAP